MVACRFATSYEKEVDYEHRLFAHWWRVWWSRDRYLSHEDEVRRMWGTCGSSSCCKAEGADILEIGDQIIRVTHRKIRVVDVKYYGFPGREPVDLQVI